MENKRMEELSLNHWQPLSTIFYDGWVLRFANGYTKRANSVSPMYESRIDLAEKIQECENIYVDHGLRPTFKITPFVHPANLDQVLEHKGYAKVDVTSVQSVSLDRIREPSLRSVHIDECVTSDWLKHFCTFNHIEDRHLGTMERMLHNIKHRKGFISFYDQNEVVGCGLGVIEKEYIGLYDIVTSQEHRSKGIGEQMILNLLQWGAANGAAHSYLAVVLNNIPAMRLYSKIGYSELYRYWYRVLTATK
jgi:N-acetylglutamate synthase